MDKSADSYKNAFSFVNNSDLRNNLEDTLQCVVELVVIAKSYPPLVRSTFYKTSIVHLASIIEATLHHAANSIIGSTFQDEDWTYRNITILGQSCDPELSKTYEIIAGQRYKKELSLKRYIDFQTLNRLCNEHQIISQTIHEKVDEIRKLRNKIHLYGLEVDRKYSLSQVDKVSKITDQVLAKVKQQLQNRKTGKRE